MSEEEEVDCNYFRFRTKELSRWLRGQENLLFIEFLFIIVVVGVWINLRVAVEKVYSVQVQDP